MPTCSPEIDRMCAVPVAANASFSFLSMPPCPEMMSALSGSPLLSPLESMNLPMRLLISSIGIRPGRLRETVSMSLSLFM